MCVRRLTCRVSPSWTTVLTTFCELGKHSSNGGIVLNAWLLERAPSFLPSEGLPCFSGEASLFWKLTLDTTALPLAFSLEARA